MSMAHERSKKLKSLVERVPPGFLVTTAWLRDELELDSRSIHEYSRDGWLQHVVRGVYQRPFPVGIEEPEASPWQIPVLSAQWLMHEVLFPGGETALNLAGYGHFLSLGSSPTVHVYGQIPGWFRRLPQTRLFTLHSMSLFDSHDLGVENSSLYRVGSSSSVDIWRWPLQVSSPERAILEVLDELPDSIGFETVDRVFEALTTLRPRLLIRLLESCRSIKVKRLFFVFADRHDHSWRKYLDPERIELGSGPRALTRGGRMHPKYRIAIPNEFIPELDSREDNA